MKGKGCVVAVGGWTPLVTYVFLDPGTATNIVVVVVAAAAAAAEVFP